MDKYTIFVSLIFIVKICFILMSVSHIYMRVTGKTDSDLDKKLVYWKERFEFVFILLMSILLIYLFNPRIDRSVMINGETKLLLYLFGIVLLITAKWEEFFNESKWFKYIQKSLGPSSS
jgi:cytochrome bd-type quinol oxidase subunit 2